MEKYLLLVSIVTTTVPHNFYTEIQSKIRKGGGGGQNEIWNGIFSFKKNLRLELKVSIVILLKFIPFKLVYPGPVF